jgi:type IX secretion system PorP/SprF family membrane protein
MKRTLLLFFFILIFTGFSTAQQQATYAQYMFNGLAINPAYAGSHGALSASALIRYQSVGVPGAPNTQTISAHSPLNNEKVALGMLVIHDKIGVIDQVGVNAIYAYRLFLSSDNESPKVLSFGLQAGFSTFRAEYSQLDIYNPTDPSFSQDITQTMPTFGFGMYYYSDKFYAGLSAPNLMYNVFDRGEDLETIVQSNPIILNSGYVFTLSRLMKLRPNFLLKLLDQKVVELDLNANLSFDDVLWLGVSYQVSSSVNLLAEVQITNQLRIGYSYAFRTSTINRVDLGSHEFMINYRFKYPKSGVVTPRHF